VAHVFISNSSKHLALTERLNSHNALSGRLGDRLMPNHHQNQDYPPTMLTRRPVIRLGLTGLAKAFF
jgi:hypothetical protein